jgi:Na+/proline symporter
VALFPVMVAAVFWKRSTKAGATAAVVSVAVFWIYFFVQGWQTPGYTVGGTGVLPAAVMVVVSSLVLVVVSFVTRPPKQDVIDMFFSDRHKT